MNDENLIPIRDSDVARKLQERSVAKRNENTKRKKAMREQLEILLNLPLKKKETKDTLKKMGVKTEDMNNQMLLLVSMYQQALKGKNSVGAFNSLLAVLGETRAPIDMSGRIDIQFLDNIPEKDDDDS